MGDTSIGLLDDCLTSLHTKQLQQRNKWRDAASRGGGPRRPAADEYSPPRKDLLRRPAGEKSLSPKPAPPAGAPPPTCRRRSVRPLAFDSMKRWVNVTSRVRQ